MAQRFAVVSAAVLCVLASPLAAQDVPATENGRYTMTQTPNGFMRLDTRTGAVSLCTLDKGVAQCRSTPDERAALEAEIARLAKENTEMKGKTAGVASSKPSELPSDHEVDRAIGFMEKFMRRMMRVMREENG